MDGNRKTKHLPRKVLRWVLRSALVVALGSFLAVIVCAPDEEKRFDLACLLLLSGNDSQPGTSVGNVPLKIFVTQASYGGKAIGGVTGADAKCNSDAGKPASGNYKALIVAGSDRRACSTAQCSGGTTEGIDWVLKPGRSYTRLDGTELGTTNAGGVFDYPLLNSFSATGSNSWTGLASDWTTHARICNGWQAGADDYGSCGDVSKKVAGTGDAANSGAVSDAGSSICETAKPLICVEQ